MSFWSVGLQVRVVDGPNKGRTYPLDAPEMTVGRARSAGDRAPGWILLFDDTVSRIQCDMRWVQEDENYVLHNRSETNPTRVNEAIVSEVVLKPGDQIRVGNSLLDVQQSDFRFGGMKPPSNRPAAVPSAPPEVTPPPAAPSDDVEKVVSAKKPRRVIPLSSRPKLQLVCLTGPEHGQVWPITGMSLIFGGPHNLDEKPVDQELITQDERIPGRALLLTWRELEGAFELSRRPEGLTLSVTLERQLDGAEWAAELPAQTPVLLRKHDIIWLGDTALQLST